MSEGSDYEDEVGSDEWSGEDDAMEEDAMTEDIDMGAGPIVLRPARVCHVLMQLVASILRQMHLNHTLHHAILYLSSRKHTLTSFNH